MIIDVDPKFYLALSPHTRTHHHHHYDVYFTVIVLFFLCDLKARIQASYLVLRQVLLSRGGGTGQGIFAPLGTLSSSKKIMVDISCELSSRKTIHITCQPLFFVKVKKIRMLQFSVAL